jgi:hypothetical protein
MPGDLVHARRVAGPHAERAGKASKRTGLTGSERAMVCPAMPWERADDPRLTGRSARKSHVMRVCCRAAAYAICEPQEASFDNATESARPGRQRTAVTR